MEKVDARSNPAAVQERVRQLAVKAVLAGKKQVEVARSLASPARRWGNGSRLTEVAAAPLLRPSAKAVPKAGRGCLGRVRKLSRRWWTITLTSSNCPSTCGPGRRSPC